MKLGPLTIDPAEFGSQGSAVLGIRGAGKSYTATLLAERLFDAGIPFVAFDPIGVWRFLRVPGAGKGRPIVVAGGEAGDLPLTPASAPKIVEAAMHNGVSLVLDLFDMALSKADWRRIVRDSVRLLLHRNKAHGLRHVFLEEAAEFAPQRVIDGEVYAEIEKLARMGGNARLGYTLINQRAEEVNKAVLELCDNLFLHRQKGRNSLTALAKWLDVGDARDGRQIVASMATLPTGECWAWMAGTERPVRMKVPTKDSLHPDRRVMRGDGDAKAKPAVDVSAFVAGLKDALPAIEAESAASDPKALRAELDKLRRQLAAKGPAVDVQAIERRGYEAGRRDGNAILSQVRHDLGKVAAMVAGMRVALGDAIGEAADTGKTADAARVFQAAKEIGRRTIFVAPKDQPTSPTLPSGEKAVLAAVAQYPAGLRRQQLGVLTGFKRSTRDAYIARLRPRGFVDLAGDRVVATPAGIAALGPDYEPPRTGNALRQHVLATLPKGEADVLAVLLEHYPAQVGRDTIDEQTGVKRSTRDAYIARLRARELVTIEGRDVRAAETLFMEAV
jgi:hypothetical protein